jgi:PIN domain nuclease of toxin-antitoxin system
LNLLLDTHALLWWLFDDPRLSQAARTAIAGQDSTVFVSPASVWEISIKQALGRLEAPPDIEGQLAASRFQTLLITVAHAYAAGSLPRHHNDPFDRMLVAQAAAQGLTIVTRDSRIARYGVPVLAA